MASSYYVTYGTDRLTFGGSGSVAWEYNPVIPVTRYEYKLWTTPDGSGKASGTLPSALSSFDEYIVAYGLRQPEYSRFYNTFNGKKNDVALQAILVDQGPSPWGYYISEAHFSANATSWTVVNNTGSCWWWIQTRFGQNGTWTAGSYDIRKIQGVHEIIGVKYQ